MLEAEHRDLLPAGPDRQGRHGALDQLHVARRPGDQRDALVGQLAPAEARIQHAQLRQRLAQMPMEPPMALTVRVAMSLARLTNSVPAYTNQLKP